MGKGDAKVKIGADASEVERAMGRAMQSVNNAGKQMTQEFNEAARAIVNDLSNVVLAGAKVNFSGQRAQILEFEKSSAKMSVSTSQGLSQIRDQAIQTGLAIGRQPNEVLKWTNSVNQLTYSFKGTNDTMIAMSNAALRTGRDVDSFSGLAVQFSKMGVEGSTVNDVLATMEGQAKATGMPFAQLLDTISASAGAMQQLGGTGASALTQISGLIGSVRAATGPGAMGDFAAQRVTPKLLSLMQGNVVGYERILGHKITDQYGHVPAEKQGELLYEATAKMARLTGGSGSDRFRRLMINSSGGDAEMGLARVNMLQNAERADVKNFDMKPVDQVKNTAQERYNLTDAGKRDQAGVKLFESSNKLLSSATLLGRAATAMEHFAAQNPIASTAAATVGGGLISSAAGKAGGSLLSAALPGGAGALLTTAGLASAAALGAAVAVGAGAGYLTGKALDKHTSFGEWLPNLLHGKSIKEEEKQKDLEAAERGEKGYLTTQQLAAAIQQAKFNLTIVNPPKGPEVISSEVNDASSHS